MSAVDVENAADIMALRSRVAELEGEVVDARRLSATITREPLTYEARLVADPRGPRGVRAISLQDDYSYIADLTRYETMTGDYRSAEQRLRRHEREMKVMAERRHAIFSHEVSVEFEKRAVNWTNGTGGYFAPPLWLIEAFAITPTPERVLSALAPSFELPLGGQSVNLPRWTAGAKAGATQLNAPVNVIDIADAAVSSAVATIAGQADVPMQMLEQSPVGAHLDWAVFTNLEATYGSELERQMITGNGSATPQGSGNNELLGLLNNTDVPAANQVTYTDATPSVGELIRTASSTQGGPLPQAIAAIGNNRRVPPEYWMMTTSRGAWITSGEVAFPLALANQTGAGHFDLLAYPVRQNDSIPTTISGNRDTIIACRPSDWIVLESERKTSVMTDVLSGSLMARLQMRRYAATLLRQPTSVAYLVGTGMTVPANF